MVLGGGGGVEGGEGECASEITHWLSVSAHVHDVIRPPPIGIPFLAQTQLGKGEGMKR